MARRWRPPQPDARFDRRVLTTRGGCLPDPVPEAAAVCVARTKPRSRRARLLDRPAERLASEGLVEDLQGERGRALMVFREGGAGKSALLESTIGAAVVMTMVRATGIESEAEFAFASVHQLCAPLLRVD